MESTSATEFKIKTYCRICAEIAVAFLPTFIINVIIIIIIVTLFAQ